MSRGAGFEMSAEVSDFAARYDRLILDPLMRKYHGAGGFYNVGYWAAGICDQERASAHLVERLLTAAPAQAGMTLDVACGLGATTRQLFDRHPGAAVTGINISLRQLGQCLKAAPGCQFVQTDAAAMGLCDSLFDLVVCVEAAFHFRTRRDFLAEAHRVLKPGGRLLLSDMLFESDEWAGGWTVGAGNQVADLSQYRRIVADAGFDQVELEDATEVCWGGFCRNLKAWLNDEHDRGELDDDLWQSWTRVVAGIESGAVRHYLLLSARKA